MKKKKQLELKFHSLPQKYKSRLIFIYKNFVYHTKLRYEFTSRKFLKKEYWPIYIAVFILFFMTVISATIVVYDTDKHITSYANLQKLFLDADYNLQKIRDKKQDVPRVFIKSLPNDFNMIENTNERKDLFIKFLLPLILQKNEELKARRDEFIRIDNKLKSSKKLTAEEQLFLENVYNDYKTETKDTSDILAKLDEISVSMALGQAIQETGWGTSRFLIQGNAIFAEWTWGGEGMLPRSRKEGMIHRIKTFPTLYDSVKSYSDNLNTTRYYAGFRRMRAKLRGEGKSLYGRYLMSSMVYYSTQKDKYILEVKRIIRDNDLDDFNNVKLAPIEKEDEKK